MTEEELLKEAKRRYPPGTKYWNLNLAGERSMGTGAPLVIPKNVRFVMTDDRSKDGQRMIRVENVDKDSEKGNRCWMGWVYSNKIWADFELPKPKIINTYSLW